MHRVLKAALLVGLSGVLCAANGSPPRVGMDVWWQSPVRNLFALRIVERYDREAFGVLRSRVRGEARRCRVGSELLAVAALVKHVDDHRRGLADEVFEDLRSGPAMDGDPRIVQIGKAAGLSVDTFRDACHTARILDGDARRESARELTQRAYCAAEALPVAHLDALPYWQDVLDERHRALAAAGVPLRQAGDGGLQVPLEHVRFETGDATLSEQAAEELRGVATRLVALPSMRIVVEGHTDPRPTRPPLPWPSNAALGEARADAATKALQEGGVPAEQLLIVSKAASEPPEDGENPRRVELAIRVCQAPRGE